MSDTEEDRDKIRDCFRRIFLEGEVKTVKKGKLIVITGPDGCGKKTQTQILVSRLKASGFRVKTIDFPQYQNTFFGNMIGRYLKGEFGEPTKISPYFASMLYAGDRWESRRQMEDWMNDEEIIVSDRYVGDNFLHQGSKIKDKIKRDEFYKWLSFLEYALYNAYESDQTFYLDVPLHISLALLEKKGAKERKGYTGGEKDGHENETHLREVREIADELIRGLDWIKIDCAPKGVLMPEKEVADIIWSLVKTS